MSIDLDYQYRIVAFIDIMGFKEHIQNTYSDTQWRKKLINTLIELKIMENKHQNPNNIYYNIDKEVTAFSDSIVISYDLAHDGAVFYILMDIIIMQIDLIASGLLIRGGVTIGLLFHNGGVVIGPAMIQAHEIESKLAIYPRILVDPKIIEYAYINPSHSNTPEQEVEHIKSILRESETEYYYTDFLSMSSELEYAYQEFLNDTHEIIEAGLSNKNISVRSKYEWLNRYYSDIVKRG